MRLYETVSFVYNKKLQDLGIDDAEDIAIRATIDLDALTKVTEWVEDDPTLDILREKCMIYTIDGESALIGTSYEELVSAWKGKEK